MTSKTVFMGCDESKPDHPALARFIGADETLRPEFIYVEEQDDFMQRVRDDFESRHIAVLYHLSRQRRPVVQPSDDQIMQYKHEWSLLEQFEFADGDRKTEAKLESSTNDILRRHRDVIRFFSHQEYFALGEPTTEQLQQFQIENDCMDRFFDSTQRLYSSIGFDIDGWPSAYVRRVVTVDDDKFGVCWKPLLRDRESTFENKTLEQVLCDPRIVAYHQCLLKDEFGVRVRNIYGDVYFIPFPEQNFENFVLHAQPLYIETRNGA